MSEQVQLALVGVTDLFGLFNHTVHLRLQDRVTILHGPNGVGKTVMLRLIQAFFEGRYDVLLGTNFKTFDLQLSDGHGVSIIRQEGSDQAEGAKPSLRIKSADGGHDDHIWMRDSAEYLRLASLVDNEVPYITRIADDAWVDDRTGEHYTVYDLVSKFRDILPGKIK